MGRDKIQLPFGGEPLLRRVVRRVSEAADEVVVVGPPERLEPLLAGLAAEVVADRWPGRGPLGGLGSGLANVTRPVSVLTGADMPLIEPALLAALAAACEGRDAAVPIVGGQPEPLCAAYRAAILPTIERLLDGDDWSLAALLRVLDVREIDEATVRAIDPALRSFINVNTPDDLERATQIVME